MEAIYSYGATCSGELSFEKGDIIRVTDVDIGSSSWWEGEFAGIVGQFPRSYVEPRVHPIGRPRSPSMAMGSSALPLADRRSSAVSAEGPASIVPPAIEGSKDVMLHGPPDSSGTGESHEPIGFLVDLLHPRKNSAGRDYHESNNQPIVQTASELNFN